MRRLLKRAAMGAAGLVLTLLVVGVAMNLWIRGRTSAVIFERAGEVPARSAAIVPGASVYGDGTPSAALEDRLEAALALYREGRVERLVVSGVDEGPYYDEVGAMRAWLLARGVPAEDVVADRLGVRTLDTMQRAARVYGIRSAVVCTQAFHLPRAVFLARDAGIDAVGLRADRRAYRRPWFDAFREFFARIRAFLDVYVLDTAPTWADERAPVGPDA